MSTVTRWVPGHDSGLVWEGGAALLEASVSLSTADAFWRRLNGGVTDLAGFCTLLAEATGLGLLDLPGFAVALMAGETVQLAARGDFVASYDDGAVRGNGLSTWAETRLVVPIDVLLGRAASASGELPYAVVSGTVPASALALRLETIGPVGVQALTPGETQIGVSQQEQTPPPVSTSGQLWGDLTLLGGRPTVSSEAATVPENEPAEPDPRDDLVPDKDSTRFDVILSVSADDPGTGHTSAEDSDEGALPVPGLLPPPLMSHASPGHVLDDDSATVIRHPRLREADVGTPRVRACVCPSGHSNPPSLRLCRVCGAALPSTTREVPRPSLGRLAVSDGTTVDLVGPVVIGREPSAVRFQGTTPPKLLKVGHAHVSANHVEIQLEGWAVLAADLGSTNGSYVRRVGQPSVRLTDDPVALAPGDILDLGHGVEITFEEPR